MIPSMERDERQSNSKTTKRSSSSNKLLKLLPRAATSAISFQNPPFSPGRSSDNNGHHHNNNNNTHHHRSQSHVGKGFSGPLMVSIIPDEARRRSKNGDGLDFGAAEPGSPKVSCMGQIKHKKKMKKKEKEKEEKAKTQLDKSRSRRHSSPKKQESAIRRIFGGRKQKKAEKKPVDTTREYDASPELARMTDRGAPGIGQMRRFASGREAFVGFDWSEVQVAPVVSVAHRDHCNADEEEEEEEEEEEVLIPFSAPIPLGGGGEVDVRGGGGGRGTEETQPRKEINLWKRRTMAPPRPLQLHPSGGRKQ